MNKELQQGAYEIEQINQEVYRQLSQTHPITNISQSPLKIEANTSTLHCITRLDDQYSVDFTKQNTLKDILGFDSRVLNSSDNYFDKKVNIIDIDRIHICTDSIIGSIRSGQRSNILYTIILNEQPGGQIVREPNLVL